MQGIRNIVRAGTALAAAAAFAAPAGAQTIVNGGLTLLSPTPIGATGGGLGAQATILTLQRQGNSTVEAGCVTPTGPVASCVGVVPTGSNDVQQGQSQVQFIAGITGSTLRVGFNATEPNNELPVTIENLNITLFSGNTALAIFNTGATPITLSNTLNGIGNFGFEFGLTTAAQLVFNSFLAQPNLSIGAGARLSQVAGGVETINLARGPSQGGGGAGSVVPEPSTYVLMGSGLLGLAGIAARRRKQQG